MSLEQEIERLKKENAEWYDKQYGHSKEQFEQLQEVASLLQIQLKEREEFIKQTIPWLIWAMRTWANSDKSDTKTIEELRKLAKEACKLTNTNYEDYI